MASNAKLKAQPRSDTGKGAVRKMRSAGRVPGVIYGHNEDTRPLSMDGHELERLFATVHVENTIIELDIEGEKQKVRALVREVQAHPWRGDLMHVDFYQIHAGEKVEVDVPIHLTGDAPGVKAGGVLAHNINDLQVRCLPDAIPESIDVDISGLDIGDSIHVSDLKLLEGVEVLIDPERTICSVTPPTVLKTADVDEDEDADALDLEGAAEPEVIGKGGDEDEGQGAEDRE